MTVEIANKNFRSIKKIVVLTLVLTATVFAWDGRKQMRAARICEQVSQIKDYSKNPNAEVTSVVCGKPSKRYQLLGPCGHVVMVTHSDLVDAPFYFVDTETKRNTE
jgi:hypothetical protein